MKRLLPIFLIFTLLLSACVSGCDFRIPPSETQSQTETATPTETPTEKQTETATETESETATETESETVTETESETVTETESETVTETESETVTETESETVTETESETVTETESETVTETESETVTETESETITETESPPVPPEECDDHTDIDNNGYCDECDISVVIILDLFAINDLHGKFTDSSSQIGVDEMTTYFKNAYLNEDHVIILSSGDMWQGSSESNLTNGNIITEWMNYIEIVSMTLGNHEYDWGEDLIVQNAALATFPFLAINVYDSDTNMRAEYCQASVMVERGGATIGIIGAIGDCYSSISGEVSDGFYFKTGSELTALVKAEAERLRAAGADYIIYSIHDGYGSSSSGVGNISDSQLKSYYDPALSNGYVDIVFEAHSHQNYVLIDSNGVYHLQGKGDNQGISHVEVKVNFANGKNNVQVAEYLTSSVYSSLADDEIVEILLEKYADQIAVGLEVLGTNDTPRGSGELCQLVADLYLKAGIEMFGSSYNIVLGGGFLKTRSPYSLTAGEVTYGQLQTILPFDNELVLCSIKGSDLLSKFINTTNTNYYISLSSYGNSIKNNIVSSATYYIIVDTYTSNYAYNNLTEIARYTPEVYARDLVAEYIKAGGLTSGGTGGTGGTGGSGGEIEITYTSISKLLEKGEGLDDNEITSEYYYVKGTVTSVKNTKYGNLYIQDSSGNSIYVYGVYDSTGSVRYDSLTDPPVAGDEIVLYARLKRYVSNYGVTIELVDAKLIQSS